MHFHYGNCWIALKNRQAIYIRTSFAVTAPSFTTNAICAIDLYYLR